MRYANTKWKLNFVHVIKLYVLQTLLNNFLYPLSGRLTITSNLAVLVEPTLERFPTVMGQLLATLENM